MPHLGFYHDDGLYWVTAKSLAEGHGYRIESLPTQPFQTKYPPLFPGLLAIAWKLNPRFPQNLPIAALLAWCVFPFYIALCWTLFKRWRFSVREQFAMTAVTALNPLAVLFSCTLMPELLFTTLLLGVLLLANRSGWVAGLLAGLAFLTKTAALPLALTVPLVLVLRRRFKHAGLFLVVFMPMVAAWQLWVQAHLVKSNDLVTLYYTDYFGFRAYNIGLRDLPWVAWHNLDALLMAIGKLLTFDVAIFESKHLERIVAVAAIAGVIRLARKLDDLHYPAFAALFGLMLLFWHYQPDQRFVFPLFPLLLAGIWVECKALNHAVLTAWRKPARGERFVPGGAWALLGACGVFVVACGVLGLYAFLPKLLNSYKADLISRRPAYEWMKSHTPPGAGVFAYDDSLVYLYTGRRSCGIPIPTKYFYYDDDAALGRLVDGIPNFARAQGLSYILVTGSDFYRDLHSAGAQRLAQVVEKTASCRTQYRSGGVTIHLLE